MKTLYNTLIRPIVTEKSIKLKDKNNQVVFEVNKFASKNKIKDSLLSLFSIKPISIKIMNCRGKKKRVGKNLGKKRNWKKAILNLKNESDVNAIDMIDVSRAINIDKDKK